MKKAICTFMAGLMLAAAAIPAVASEPVDVGASADELLGGGSVVLEEGKIVIRTQIENESVAPASPYIPCAGMDEAAMLAGFSMTVPGSPDAIEAWEDGMIQAIYGAEQETMRIRKGPGSEDISGDYNDYAQVKLVDGATLKGENGRFSLAVWTSGGYAYSLSVEEALPASELLALAGQIS